MILFDYLPLLLGKVLGKIVHIIYVLMFIFECSLMLVLFADVIRDWVFLRTPAWVILAFMLLTSLYILKNERNVSISGMDQGADGMLQSTVSIRDITMTEAGSKDRSEVHSVMARSSQYANELIDEEVSGGFSSAKMRVLLIGEALVKNSDIKPYLDVYYRDPKSPLPARIAVTRGKAKDMIEP
jgi:hypothetical protein